MSTESMEYAIYLYYGVSLLIAAAVVTSLVLGVTYLIGGLVGWKTPHRKRRLVRSGLWLLGVPLFIGLQFLFVYGVFMPYLGRIQQAEFDASRAERLAETTLAMPGVAAPDFDVVNVDGEPFSLADQRGKVVLINFFATWCGPCLLELPHMQELWERHQDDDRFTMLVVGREEPNETVVAFRKSKGFTFPMAADPERGVYDLYAKEGIPRTVLVSQTGEVLFSTLGFYEQDLAELERLIQQRLATKE
jgi:peroxiredoxin